MTNTKSSSANSGNAPTPEAEELFALLHEALRIGFKLRALGTRVGANTKWGGGVWGLLRSLELEGPQTVPQLARARPVARQRIQKLSDEMAELGLVAFVDNPAHKRSRLLQITPAGRRRYRDLTSALMGLSASLAEGMNMRDLQKAHLVLKEIGTGLSDRLSGEDGG